MKPTKHAVQLRALAARILPRITRPGDAAALTGSAARGNARADSDLDVWILGSRSGRFVRRIDGVSVTLLCQTPAEAERFENLCLYEVDDLLVLEDGSGAFAHLKENWRKHRRRIRAEIIRSTEAQIGWELDRAEKGSALHRGAFLRFACWRLVILRVYIDRGWRVPRLHLLREQLPAPLRRHLDSALALPNAAACRRALKLMPAALKEVRAIAGDDGYSLPESIADKAKLAPGEGALVARKELLFELMPRVFAEYGITDVRGVELLGSVAPKLRAAFLALEPRANDATVKKLRGHVEALERSLKP
jgi:predicted nucleotidyltransferase